MKKKVVPEHKKVVVSEEEKSLDLGMESEDGIPFNVVTDEQIK